MKRCNKGCNYPHCWTNGV